MKTIPEIVNFFNDDQAYITTEDQPVFTFADIKKQIDSTKDFFEKNHIQKTDTIAIVCENGPVMATSFLATASNFWIIGENPKCFEFFIAEKSCQTSGHIQILEGSHEIRNFTIRFPIEK